MVILFAFFDFVVEIVDLLLQVANLGRYWRAVRHNKIVDDELDGSVPETSLVHDFSFHERENVVFCNSVLQEVLVDYIKLSGIFGVLLFYKLL